MKNIKCRNCFFYRNEWCKKIVDSPDPEEARDCNYFREMTNADRIRSMTDEELVKLHYSGSAHCIADDPTVCDRHDFIGNLTPCEQCYLKWLQQPAESELRECPFCGGKAELFHSYDGYHCVQCTCYACGTIHMRTERAAIRMWNRRAGEEYKRGEQ